MPHSLLPLLCLSALEVSSLVAPRVPSTVRRAAARLTAVAPGLTDEDIQIISDKVVATGASELLAELSPSDQVDAYSICLAESAVSTVFSMASLRNLQHSSTIDDHSFPIVCGMKQNEPHLT